MTAAAPTIATAELQVGMFVHLDLGWMSHPFALSSFRIVSASEIATIRSLGLAHVRWSPEHSEPALVATLHGRPPDSLPTPGVTDAAPDDEPAPARTRTTPDRSSRRPRSPAQQQRDAAERVERQYAEAARDWRTAARLAQSDPAAAGPRLDALTRALVDKMLGARDLSIRAVVGESAIDRAGHAMNVGVISLLMGRLCGLAEADLLDLGVGALAHDIGKLELPGHLHRPDERWSSAETAHYREHVALGVALGQRMGLAPGALLVIGQHHELCDGSGFPQGIEGNRMSVAARLVALVNRYDNLCRPADPARALTPHDAMSRLFSQGQKRFDPALLSTFVRMMGVYPPGSVVQLTDDRFAVVESVSAARPLKPKVSVPAPGGADEALQLVDLALEPALGIRRSLPAERLPPPLRELLLPRPRASWFFEADEDPTEKAEGAPPH